MVGEQHCRTMSVTFCRTNAATVNVYAQIRAMRAWVCVLVRLIHFSLHFTTISTENHIFSAAILNDVRNEKTICNYLFCFPQSTKYCFMNAISAAPKSWTQMVCEAVSVKFTLSETLKANGHLRCGSRHSFINVRQEMLNRLNLYELNNLKQLNALIEPLELWIFASRRMRLRRTYGFIYINKSQSGQGMICRLFSLPM